MPPNKGEVSFFLTSGADSPPLPSDFYALVDQVEDPLETEGTATARLDCVGAAWFDGRAEADDLSSEVSSWPLAIIEVSLPPEERGLKSAFRLRQEGQWWRVRFEAAGELRSLRFSNLFGEGEEGAVSTVDEVDYEKLAQLRKHFSIRRVPLLSEGELNRFLRGRTQPDFVGVLDVGQGNFNGLWESHGAALLYFDAGGGVTQHAKTFPSRFVPCTVPSPPVFLSHWDWDHWSSGARFPYLQKGIWIVPDQAPLGAIHAAFAIKLMLRGTVRRWPSAWRRRTRGRIEIERCTGTSRNGSGLALRVRGKSTSGSAEDVLLTGDADYSEVPSVNRSSGSVAHAVVVPHHGGKAHGHPGVTVHPAGKQTGRHVYSYGRPNHYGHPHKSTEQDHLAAGWSTSGRRDTAARGKRPQHIAITWSSATATPQCGCSKCQFLT